MGVFLAADLFTLFVFFEMMSFTSYVWVVQNETEEARQAGQTYLAVAVIGGMALLAGL
uniref:proton-conducting transporter transmembrane domain-containing protein n=3 Tax=Eubacteriales TaxID=186802 RepID=UPI003FF0425E